jgi:hypothetical protein
VPRQVERTISVPNPAYRAPEKTPTLPKSFNAVPAMSRRPEMASLNISPIGTGAWGFDAFSSAPSMPSLSQGFAAAGNSLFGGLSDAMLAGLGYGPGSSFTGGWGGPGSGPGGTGMGWGDGGPGGYGGGSVYDGNSGPYSGGDNRFDGGWGGVSDGDTYR